VHGLSVHGVLRRRLARDEAGVARPAAPQFASAHALSNATKPRRGVFWRAGAAEQRPRSCSGIIPATPSDQRRVISSLGVFKVLNPTRLRNSAQGKGPIRCATATAECRRAECSDRPPRSGCDFLPLEAERHAPSHVHWQCSVHCVCLAGLRTLKGPVCSLPNARACAVVPRLPEPFSGDASLYVVYMLHGMAFAGDFHVHPAQR